MSTPAPALPRAASIPSLDGVRALAVALVFFAHGGLQNIVPGGLGVTIFFVLSGYLITTLMRVEFAERGDLSFRAFYLRRALRLMPPLLLVVAGTALLWSAGLVDGRFTPGGLLSVLFYGGNYFVIAQDFDGVPAGLGVTWSLAVEEHFYLVYPPLALWLLRGGSARRAGLVLGALCALILGWRCVLAVQGGWDAHIGMATDTRVDSILAGCLLALLRNPWLEPPARERPRAEAALALLCLGLLAATLLYRNDFFRLTLRYSLQSLAVAPLLYLAVARSSRWPYRWLNAPAMVWLGTVSYTIYLSHQVLLYAVARQWPALGEAATMATALTATLILAELMRRAVEQPCARLRKQLHRRMEWPATLNAPRLPTAAS